MLNISEVTMKNTNNKIKFRKHIKKDIPYRVKWLNNEKVSNLAIENPQKKTNAAEQAEWFKKYLESKNKKFFTIIYREAPIGFVGLSNIDLKKKTASLFIMIGEQKYQGRGFGSLTLNYILNFGFKKLGLSKICLEVNRKNKPAIALYKKFGFRIINKGDKEMVMELDQKD